jgi:hypothetical protein
MAAKTIDAVIGKDLQEDVSIQFFLIGLDWSINLDRL